MTMAVTIEGARLTEAHRQAQARLVQELIQSALVVWPTLNPNALDATFPQYADLMIALIADYKRRSAAIAAQYIRAFRQAEGVSGEVDVAFLDELARRQALTSLLVTGPVAVKVGVREGKPLELAHRNALAMTLGAAARLTLQGSRDTIIGTMRRDRQALGYARVTDGSPCAFCAMLASRGAVYKSKETAGFEPHDKCGCQPELVYDDQKYNLPGRAGEFSQLWAESTAGLSGREARNAFRRAYMAKYGTN